MPWLGTKKIAFVPLYRPHAKPLPDVIPDNWPAKILARTLNDPRGTPPIDHSLRSYIRSASSGLADLTASVMPMQTLDQQDVEPNALEGLLGAQLRKQGFDAAALVMLGQPPTGSTQGFWCRFDMSEAVGVWAMEAMHSLTGCIDLYDNGGNIGSFDEMACACGTHPSAATKVAIQWLAASAVMQLVGVTGNFDLYSVGLHQPPPAGRATAVQIGTAMPYLMVESRQHSDAFDAGIPSEGVIVYQVRAPFFTAPPADVPPVVLLTKTALGVGGSYTSPDGFVIQVTKALGNGFSVAITNTLKTVVPDYFEMSTTEARNASKASGLVPVFTGPNQKRSWVAQQSPSRDQIVAKGSQVHLTLNIGNMP